MIEEPVTYNHREVPMKMLERQGRNTAQAMFAELMTLILSKPDFIGVVFVRDEEQP